MVITKQAALSTSRLQIKWIFNFVHSTEQYSILTLIVPEFQYFTGRQPLYACCRKSIEKEGKFWRKFPAENQIHMSYFACPFRDICAIFALLKTQTSNKTITSGWKHQTIEISKLMNSIVLSSGMIMFFKNISWMTGKLLN